MKDPYIFDLAGTKEKTDERDIEEQLVKHVTQYLLEMGKGFAFVARQKHFQVGNRWFKPNHHAYVVFDWMNHETGKSRKLNDEDMAAMQIRHSSLNCLLSRMIFLGLKKVRLMKINWC